MNSNKGLIYFILITLLLCGFATNVTASGQKAKSIIFMVPDGMGLADVTAVRIYKFGPGKGRFSFEQLPQIGYQSTFSANSIVTDSAAAASAWACGQKFNNGEISFHSDSQVAPLSILEIAKKLNKATGLVATSTITHATPAAFGAHVKDRGCEIEIARQYIQQTKVDVILGGGKARFNSSKADRCGAQGDFISEAKTNGYTFVTSREELLKIDQPQKLLGLFNNQPLTPAYKKSADDSNAKNEPSLAEMTQAALSVLEKDDNGFFLLVEGSQVDWANHQNDFDYQIGELVEFDKAVGTVLDWIKAQPNRIEETLLIVVPDHDTGGFAINGPYGSSFSSAGQKIEVAWTTHNHTGVDTIIWSQGPYSQFLGKAIDNTDIYHIMKAALFGENYTR